jgi:hypothetical protein
MITVLLSRMPRMRWFLIALAGLLWSTCAPADEFDFSFNADAVRGQYARPFGASAVQWDVGWLHHQDNGDVIHGSVSLTGKASEGRYPVRGGLGLRLVYTDGDLRDQDGYAAAVGGFFTYVIPRYNRFSLGGHAYFAPEVLSMGDMEEYQDFSLRLNYNLLRDADVYVGARYVRGEYDDVRAARFDTGMHVGFALRF